MNNKRIKLSIPIPEGICFNVLARLPAKSLMRFKCVCKLWCSFMHDPFFIQLHSFHSKTRHGNTVISFTDQSSSMQYFYFANSEGNPDPCKGTISMPAYWCISEIVNGLICLIGPRDVSICNLSTHEIMTLPDSIPDQRYDSSRECHTCFLFGSDSLAKVYKVLRVSTVVTVNKVGYRRSRKTCNIFRLDGTSWKRIKSQPCRFPSRTGPASGDYRLHVASVCVNGVIYWLQHANWKGQYDIGAFDVAQEKFLPVIPVPEDAPSFYDVEYPLQIGGNLALANQHSRGESRIKIDMWILEDYQNKVWTKKEILLQEIHLRRHMFPIGNIHNGEILVIPKYFSSNSLKLAYYDQKTLSYRENEKNVLAKEGIFSVITNQDECPYGACFLKEEWTPYYRTGEGMKLIRFFTTDGLENILPLRKDN